MGIYILDSNQNPLYVEEFYEQSSKDVHGGLVSNLVVALQQFAAEMGEAVESVEIGGFKMLISRDRDSETKFILKCSKKAKVKRNSDILNQIQIAFLDIFSGSLDANKKMRKRLIHQFSEKLEKIIQKPNHVADFLGIL